VFSVASAFRRKDPDHRLKYRRPMEERMLRIAAIGMAVVGAGAVGQGRTAAGR
jgi:hypothetical protein